MAGASVRKESRERIAAEAEARREEIAETAPENAAAEQGGFWSNIWESITGGVTESVVNNAQLFQDDFINQIQAMSPEERFQAIKAEVPRAGQPMLTKMEEAGIGEAFGNAFAFNENFREYVQTKLVSGDESFRSVFNNIDPAYAGPIADILNSAAKDPNYDTQKIDNVVSTFQEHANLVTLRNEALEQDPNADVSDLDDRIIDAQNDLFDAVQDAGGNIPAFARFQPEMMKNFFSALFQPGMDNAQGALNNLAADLQLSGAELEAFQNLMGPLAKIMEFMFQPYADLWNKHGDNVISGVKNMADDFQVATGGSRVQFVNPTTAPAPTV